MRKNFKALAAIGFIVGMGTLLGTSMAQAAVVTLHSEIDVTAINLNTSVIDLTGSAPETTSFAAGNTLKLVTVSAAPAILTSICGRSAGKSGRLGLSERVALGSLAMWRNKSGESDRPQRRGA